MIIKNIFEKDYYWKILETIALLTFPFIDLMSNGYYLNWMGLKTVILIYAFSAIKFILKKNKNRKKIGNFKNNIKHYEIKQLFLIKEKIRTSPDFQTLCYECVHFNKDLLNCTLKHKLGFIPTHKKITNQIPHCLYWKNINRFDINKIEEYEMFLF
jgi:hypothetical protein